ncbi:hypothetical protein BAE44_0009392 [Dichanthelium oligosanthes]|uniref:Uncharacterized protein n=1 Tax=Dichanthelium oligosanthes TaxID=888268 RepID=A0A1E5VWY8_9POAL|nr:hypothetical protein BAE44_0009392 [Dichanthelium oligosanthes]
MAAHQQHHRLRPPQPPRLLHHVFVSACCIRRARPPSASFRPPPAPSLPYPLPKKRADYEAAADFGEEDGAVVVDETTETEEQREYGGGGYASSVGAGTGLPALLRAGRAGPGGDPVFFLLTAVAVTTSVAFSSMVAVAVPTMLAMRRAANSFTMLADAALEELPSTMAAVRLSGMEISDLTVELSDLSHEISDGVNKSAKVVQAVEASIGQMGDIARQQAISMVKERASLQTIPTAVLDHKFQKSSSQQQRRERGENI